MSVTLITRPHPNQTRTSIHHHIVGHPECVVQYISKPDPVESMSRSSLRLLSQQTAELPYETLRLAFINYSTITTLSIK